MTTNYEHLYTIAVLRPDKIVEIDFAVCRIRSGQVRYEAVAAKIGNGIPWWFIGIIHVMEGGGKFTTHLHNGDPLSARTVNVPKGRPVKGQPPFTWEVSAEDAIRYMKYDKITDWSIASVLYLLEKYNGFGYMKKGLLSPYLWSYTNHYTKGKYSSDGKYDPLLVSKQPGAAAIMKRMGIV
jgi:lysozyme family protein